MQFVSIRRLCFWSLKFIVSEMPQIFIGGKKVKMALTSYQIMNQLVKLMMMMILLRKEMPFSMPFSMLTQCCKMRCGINFILPFNDFLLLVFQDESWYQLTFLDFFNLYFDEEHFNNIGVANWKNKLQAFFFVCFFFHWKLIRKSWTSYLQIIPRVLFST